MNAVPKRMEQIDLATDLLVDLSIEGRSSDDL
jgi:hypothetical protein